VKRSSPAVRRLVDDLVELDVVAKQILFGGDRATISAELGRRLARGEASRMDRLVCRLLDHFEKNHCLEAARRARPPSRRRRARRRVEPDDDGYGVFHTPWGDEDYND